MKILSLELENIKSYRRASIDFTPGLNAVCGSNGSGKTTVLESIGFALFDYLPYSQAAFVREGEKSGAIRIRIVAGDDREYEVVRKLGSGAAYYVTDVESGTRLAERGENVLDWIGTQALNLESGAELKTLFKDAVGVPQGSMTGHFLAATTQRKAVFDPLLRVQEYREAYDELRDTTSYLKDLTASKREDIAALLSRTDEIPGKERERDELRNRVERADAELVVLAAELTETERLKNSLDGAQEQLRALSAQSDISRMEVQRHASALEDGQKSLEKARAARRIAQESEPGYRLVQEARRQLTVLDARRKERDTLAQQLAHAQSERKGIWGRIEGLDEQILQATSAGAEAAALVNSVRIQTALDDRLTVARSRLGDAPMLDSQIVSRQNEVAELERLCDERVIVLEKARAAGRDIIRLAPLENDLVTVTEKLAAIAPLHSRLRTLKEEGTRLRTKYDNLSRDVAARQEFLEQIASQVESAATIDSHLLEESALRSEEARVGATIEYQQVARDELTQRRCPLLEIRCPVVAVDESALERFETRIETLAGRSREIKNALQAVAAKLSVARAAATAVQALQVKAAQLEGSAAQIEAVRRDLERCRTEYASLISAVDEEQSLRQSHASMTKELKELREKSQLAALLTVLEGQQKRDLQQFATKKDELTQLEERRGALRAVEAEEQAILAELGSLNDPRSRQQSLLAVAQRRLDLESRLQAEHEAYKVESFKVKALVAQVEAYASVDTEIEQQRSSEQEHMLASELYLAHRDEAEHVEARQETVVVMGRNVDAACKHEAEVRQRLEEAQARYDSDEHASLTDKCKYLNQKVAAAREGSRHLTNELTRLKTDLALLYHKADQLVVRQEELAELGRVSLAISFIRDTIKAAGPVVTETLLASISSTANDLFAEIMDDHASELRWDRDYEVLVQRGSEIRKFVQLSGGEQMSAALAVRLALLKELSGINFAFFDEPTQNMDEDRRANLADQIRAIRGFDQLVVISHDDTFEHHTDNLIRLSKIHDESEVAAG